MEYKILKFDSDLFGFKVAKIMPAKLSPTKLRSILEKLLEQKVKLVYWQANSTDKKSKDTARELKGHLCNKQITFSIDLNKIKPTPKKPQEIKVYRCKTPTPEMKKMAIQIGEPSRFGVDPKMPKKLFHKMYHAWLENSVNGTIADKVLVIKNKTKIIGMITLGVKNKRGDIGLIAVNTKHRGKKFGTKLIEAAENYFIKNGLSKLQVVTQKSNIPACKLYKKSGFKEEKIDNFYHFWL